MSEREKSFQLETFLPYRVFVAGGFVSLLIETLCAAQFALTLPQWRILVTLGADGPTPQLKFVRRSAMEKVTVSRAASALTKRGLIASHPGHGDRRIRLLELTSEGRAFYRDVAAASSGLEAELLRRAGLGDGADLAYQLSRLEIAARMIARSVLPASGAGAEDGSNA